MSSVARIAKGQKKTQPLHTEAGVSRQAYAHQCSLEEQHTYSLQHGAFFVNWGLSFLNDFAEIFGLRLGSEAQGHALEFFGDRV